MTSKDRPTLPPGDITVEFTKLQRSRAYDLVMRLPLFIWALAGTTAWMYGLVRYLRSADAGVPFALHAINIAMRLAAIAFLVLLAASVVLRARPARRARGLEPRVSALLGTLIVYSFGLFPRRDLSVGAEIASTSLILIGSGAAVFVLAQLGRSFSVMAEARRLVTSGIYGIVRHPLYLAEELAIIGIFVQFFSVWTALLLAAQIAFQLRRMRNEEIVLAETFPEYTVYQQKTARLVPGIY